MNASEEYPALKIGVELDYIEQQPRIPEFDLTPLRKPETLQVLHCV
jgi:hypothetical protein